MNWELVAQIVYVVLMLLALGLGVVGVILMMKGY